MIDAGRRSSVPAAALRLAGASVLALLVLLLSPGGASASSDYRYWTSFGDGLIGGEAHIAVDESSGSSAHDFYVADTFHYRVLKFSPEGQFILMFGDEVDATTGGDICTAASGDECKEGVPTPVEIPEDAPSPGFSYASDLAVDGSTGPTVGDVYIVDSAHQRVLRFDQEGHRDSLWADEGELHTAGAAGVAVDSAGRLLVLDLGSQDAIRSFDPDAEELGSMDVDWGGYPIDLEVDSADDVYFPETNRRIAEFAPDGSRLRSFELESDQSGFAVDGEKGKVFLSRRQLGIAGFLAGCTGDPCFPSEFFGERYLGAPGDLVFDGSDANLYALDFHNGGASIAVFLPASEIPEVTTAMAHVSGENVAELRGRMDVPGLAAVYACRFEYVTEAGFEEDAFSGASSIPCAQSTPIFRTSDVWAVLRGLERGTSYRYRLVAETAERTVLGYDERFTTQVLPRATTRPVLAVGSESAVLSGSVESPSVRPAVKCEFEVVAESVYAASGFLGASSFPCNPIPFYEPDVEVDVSGEAKSLWPGETYRFRIAVSNSDGTVYGNGQAFRTASVGREPEPPVELPERPGHRPHTGKVPCTKKACSRVLDSSSRARVWVSPRFPQTYGWLFEIRVDGASLHHTALEKDCRSTFAGHGVIAKFNGCHGRIRLVYRGSGSIRLHWRLFAQCRCGEVARAGVSVAPWTPR